MLRRLWEGAADLAALVLFPFPRHTDVTLVVYTVILALGLWAWSGNWLWVPGVILCMTLAWMIDRWML